MPTYFSLSFQHFAPNDPPFRVRPPRTVESEDEMSTESKTNANRDNSKKSSGPRTAEGKARSSRNSTVHGLTGKSPILPGEDPADLLDLAERYHADLKPDGAVEEDLVERMAVATYRLRRIARIEVGYFDLRLRYHPMPEQLNKDGRTDPLAFAYHFDCSEEQVFDRLSRYESRIQRDYSRCLKDLQTLQNARKKEIIQTNPKRKVTPLHPAPSGDSDTSEQPASDAPTPAAAPPDAEK